MGRAPLAVVPPAEAASSRIAAMHARTDLATKAVLAETVSAAVRMFVNRDPERHNDIIRVFRSHHMILAEGRAGQLIRTECSYMHDRIQHVVIHVGPSMLPILRDGDRLVVVTYDARKMRRGDVIVFTPPAGNHRITHRIIAMDSRGIRTRGDNNEGIDPWVLTRDEILGRVVCAHRGQRQLRISGGPVGAMLSLTLRFLGRIDRRLSSFLRPAYHRLSQTARLWRWVPPRYRVRVLSFNRPAGVELHLVMGKRPVGRKLPNRKEWRIRRPFRLFVDADSLPETGRESTRDHGLRSSRRGVDSTGDQSAASIEGADSRRQSPA